MFSSCSFSAELPSGMSTKPINLAVASMSIALPYILDLVTAPVGSIVDGTEMAEYLRRDSPEELRLIQQNLAGATDYVQQVSGKQLLTATYDVSWCRFPGCNGELVLPRLPASSVTSVSYVDQNGTTQVLSASSYTVNNGSDHVSAYVIPAHNANWPSTRGHDRDVTVRFVCGFGTKQQVPDTYKIQVCMLAAHWFENRGAIACGAMAKMPLAFEALEQFHTHHEFV